METCLKATEAKLPGTIERWSKAFPKNAVYRGSDIVTSVLMPAMGSAEMDSVRAALLPEGLCLSSDIRAFRAETEAFKLYGESDTYVYYDFVFYASLRIQLEGTSKFVMYPTDLFVRLVVSEDNADLKSMQLSDVRDKLKDLSKDELNRLFDATCPAYHVELAPNEVLFIPAGWIVAQGNFNSKVWALRCTALMSTPAALESAMTQFQTLRHFNMRPSTRQSLSILLDMLDAQKTKAGIAEEQDGDKTEKPSENAEESVDDAAGGE